MQKFCNSTQNRGKLFEFRDFFPAEFSLSGDVFGRLSQTLTWSQNLLFLRGFFFAFGLLL